MADERELYENRSGGQVGACQIDKRGERRWIAVGPDERVWLNEEEKIAMAEAPKDPADNPFIEREEDEVDDDGKIIGKVKLEPMLLQVAGARPVTSNRPITPQGSYADNEEVGTPG
jgi:hypothetical protein